MFSFCWNLPVIAELLYRLYRCGSLLQVKASKFYNWVLDKALIFPFSLLTDVLGWFWAPSGSCISLKQQNCLFCVNWIAGTHSLLDFSSPSRKWLCWLVMVFWYCWTSSLWAAASMGVLRSWLVLRFEGKKKQPQPTKNLMQVLKSHALQVPFVILQVAVAVWPPQSVIRMNASALLQSAWELVLSVECPHHSSFQRSD